MNDQMRDYAAIGRPRNGLIRVCAIAITADADLWRTVRGTRTSQRTICPQETPSPCSSLPRRKRLPRRWRS
jgi:hypothetical protein